MAGIYLHIPFCKTRCIYCDFYSTTRSELITRYIHALCNELEMRKEYLKEEKIETVYFGGGTPSQLGEEDFQQIFKAIQKHYGLEDCREITRGRPQMPGSRLSKYQYRPHIRTAGRNQGTVGEGSSTSYQPECRTHFSLSSDL